MTDSDFNRAQRYKRLYRLLASSVVGYKQYNACRTIECKPAERLLLAQQDITVVYHEDCCGCRVYWLQACAAFQPLFMHSALSYGIPVLTTLPPLFLLQPHTPSLVPPLFHLAPAHTLVAHLSHPLLIGFLAPPSPKASLYPPKPSLFLSPTHPCSTDLVAKQLCACSRFALQIQRPLQRFSTHATAMILGLAVSELEA